jgi:hypothetical protein
MMACVVAIVIALAHSKHCNGVEQFDVVTVASLSLIDSSTAKGSQQLYSVGYNEVCRHNFFNLLSTFTIPHCQVDG